MNDGRRLEAAIYLLFIAAAVVVLPFNALPYGKSIFGELANEAAFFPALAAIVIWAMRGGRFVFARNWSALFLFLFVVWVAISGVANLGDIASAEIKGRSGAEKLISQYALLLFVSLFTLLVYRATVETPQFFVQFRRYVAYSLLVPSVYCILEILAMNNNELAVASVSAIDPWIRDENAFGSFHFTRLRSVSGEPSFFGMYLALVFPWIFSYLLTETARRWRYSILMVFLLLLVSLTYSRTAYATIGVEFGLLLVGSVWYQRRNLNNALFAVSSIVFVMLAVVWAVVGANTIIDAAYQVFASLFDTTNLSNIARVGSQMAAYDIALHNPSVGVGFGQYGFYMPGHVPEWAWVSKEVQEWANPLPHTPWAPALGLYARLAAELGIVGLVVWMGIWISALVGGYRRFRLNSIENGKCDAFGLALLASLIGVLLAGFAFDSLRSIGYWLVLAMSWQYIQASKFGRP